MVDPKETNERTVETEAGLGQAARKVWVRPRVESFDVTIDTAATPHTPGNDGSHSIS